MNPRHTVRAVRAYDGKVRHADLFLVTLFDQADTQDAFFVPREAAPDITEQTPVDLENDLQLTRKHDFKPPERPFLESLRQERVICVGQDLLREIPSLVPSKMRLIEQNPHQFGNGHRRMSVVELDGRLVSKPTPVGVVSAVAPHKVGQRASNEEVFLQEA